MDPRKTVLIVEDDMATSLILNIWLRSHFVILLACDGEDALTVIEKEMKTGRQIDLFFFDINLPYPWSGLSLKKAITERWPALNSRPFLAETAFAMPQDREEIMKAGFSECLTKPLDRERVVETIEKYL